MQQQIEQQAEQEKEVHSPEKTIETKPSNTQNKGPKIKRSQVVIFLLTAFLYALNHALRTVWGYTKPYLSKANTYYSSSRLGVIDFAFAVSYASGQYINGSLADRLNIKVILFVGSVLAIVGLCLLASVEAFLALDSLVLDVFAFVLNGLGQSAGYPTCVKIVSNWFSPEYKGLVFGIWGTNLNIGNIIGQQIGNIAMNMKGLSWQYPLYITCGIFSIVLVLTMIFVRSHPRKRSQKQNRVRPANEDPESIIKPLLASSHNKQSEIKQLPPIPFLDAWKIKNLPLFAVSVFCVKGVYNGLMFWLPLYLTDNVKLTGDISALLAAVEIGMLIGSAISGLTSDKARSRSLVISSGFFFSVLFLVSINLVEGSQSKVLYFFLLMAAGMGMGGANSLIGGTVSTELGADLSSEKGLNATSTIVGIMEGSGGIGSAVTQLFVANFTDYTFEYFATLCLLGGLFLIPVTIRDYKNQRTVNRKLAYSMFQSSFD